MTALEFVKDQITALGINYEYKEWTGKDKPKLYFIGEELKESEPKDDSISSTLTIVSHNSGGFKDFFEAVNKMKKHFNPRNNVKTETENGSIRLLLGGCKITPPEKEGERTTAKISLIIKEKITTV